VISDLTSVAAFLVVTAFTSLLSEYNELNVYLNVQTGVPANGNITDSTQASSVKSWIFVTLSIEAS
jgi:hypothetical protein